MGAAAECPVSHPMAATLLAGALPGGAVQRISREPGESLRPFPLNAQEAGLESDNLRGRDGRWPWGGSREDRGPQLDTDSEEEGRKTTLKESPGACMGFSGNKRQANGVERNFQTSG